MDKLIELQREWEAIEYAMSSGLVEGDEAKAAMARSLEIESEMEKLSDLVRKNESDDNSM